MKFLDLNTGYSFDGLWKNTGAYTDWTIVKRVLPKYCGKCDNVSNVNDSELNVLRFNPDIEILYASDTAAKNPDTDGEKYWFNIFDFDNTCKYAYRTKIPQQKGYIFWFPKEQSIGITYTMPICVLLDYDIDLNVSIEDNSIFSFITTNDTTTIVDGYEFNEPVYCNSLVVKSQQISDNLFAYVFNVAGYSDNSGEYICKININNEGFIKIGADFYGENEAAYINLSNLGVELSTDIQKAIYCSNVHEDSIDNILINRKFKELLSNYWEIIANKGSYKSLLSSIKWFEWGDLLNIKEVYNTNEFNTPLITRLAEKEIKPIFENKIEDTYNNFTKTAYISLYCTLYNELPTYDNEYNPEIADAVLKWSKDDIKLKIALLTNHFKEHFLPIHLSILQSCADNIVFTNTIKTLHGSDIQRTDCFGDFVNVLSNISDNDVFRITNVRAQVSDKTMFGIKHPIEGFLGVDEFPQNVVIDENNIKTFAAQYYTGPGVIIPVKITIPEQTLGDFVKQTIVDYTIEKEKTHNRFFFYDIFKVKNSDINIEFNLLVRTAGTHTLTFTFILASGKTITKNINLTVIDTDNININIYKVKSKNDEAGFTIKDFLDTKSCKYLFKIQKEKELSYYTQYLPYLLTDSKDYTGIKLNRTVIFDIQNKKGTFIRPYTNREIETIQNIMRPNFLEFTKYDYTDPNAPILTYLIYVSKKFFEDIPVDISNNINTHNIIRNDLGFYPQFHYLDRICKNGSTIDDFSVLPYEALCCAIEINNGKTTEEFKYGHVIDDCEWTFTNNTNIETIYHPASTRLPFIADSNKSLLKPGYYDITFKYSLSDGIIHECSLKSAFRITNV